MLRERAHDGVARESAVEVESVPRRAGLSERTRADGSPAGAPKFLRSSCDRFTSAIAVSIFAAGVVSWIGVCGTCTEGGRG